MRDATSVVRGDVRESTSCGTEELSPESNVQKRYLQPSQKLPILYQIIYLDGMFKTLGHSHKRDWFAFSTEESANRTVKATSEREDPI